jgi:Dolichyl-phosphate-mannose-protein mannosyltransferase
MSNYTLRAFLIQWQFWALEAQFACVVVTTLIEARRLAVARATVAVGCVVAVCAYLITATVPPRTSRIYYDEQIYQGVARNLTDLHRAQMCNEGVVEYGRLDCHQGEYNKEPYGYPYLLSVVYRVTGVSDHAAFRFNNVVAGLAVLVTMVLADLLFQDFRVAILSGLTLALFPMQLQWGNTAAAEPAAALFCAASAAAAAHFARARTTSALVWAVALAGFTIAVRPECVLIVPVMAAAIALLAPDEFRRPRLWLAALGGAVFVSMSLLHLAAVRNEGWGAASAAMGWVYAGPNFKVNFWFFFGDQRFPVLCGVAALVGLAAGAARLRERLFLLIYFLAFWLVFLFFYAGSYNYGADVRYSLMVYVPAAILAAVGLLQIAGAASRMLRLQLSDGQRLAAAIVVVLASFSWYAPLVRATGEEAWGARADVAVAKEFAARLPPNAMVLTHNPSMFHLWNVNAAQTSTIRSNPRFGDYFFPRYAGGVYLHWNYWCNVPDRVQNAFCQEVLSAFPHELVESRRVRDFEYRLYRLRPPPPPLPPPPLAP